MPLLSQGRFGQRMAIRPDPKSPCAGLPLFMKQLGVRPYWSIDGEAYEYSESTGEGKHMVEWPEEIRIQQLMTVAFPLYTNDKCKANNSIPSLGKWP